jgi:uncharacterized protein (DUF2062 family)
MTHEPKAGLSRLNPWRRWLVEPALRQLTQGVTPQKISLAIAVGSALALFPIPGTTTALCALAGVSLGLNQGIIQGMNALCFIVYFPLAVAFVRFGDALAGSAPSSVNLQLMARLLAHDPGRFLRDFGTTALHGILGWAVVAPVWIALVYMVALRPLRAAAHRTPAGKK